MTRMNELIPRKSIAPIMGTVLANLLAYYCTRLIPNRQYINVEIEADKLIPLVPGMIFVYVLAFVSWALGAWIVANDTEPRCARLFFAEQLATLICMLFFMFMPTKMVRPELGEPGSLADWILHFIYSVDSPDNLFPSLHCVENWAIFRAVASNQKMPRWVKAGFFVFALLVFASVVMVKQHVVLDILGAVAVVELSLLISKLARAERFYMGLNRRLFP